MGHRDRRWTISIGTCIDSGETVNYCKTSNLVLLHKVYIRYVRVTEGSASVTIRLSKVLGGEILNNATILFGNRVCSLIDASSFGWPF